MLVCLCISTQDIKHRQKSAVAVEGVIQLMGLKFIRAQINQSNRNGRTSALQHICPPAADLDYLQPTLSVRKHREAEDNKHSPVQLCFGAVRGNKSLIPLDTLDLAEDVPVAGCVRLVFSLGHSK